MKQKLNEHPERGAFLFGGEYEREDSKAGACFQL